MWLRSMRTELEVGRALALTVLEEPGEMIGPLRDEDGGPGGTGLELLDRPEGDRDPPQLGLASSGVGAGRRVRFGVAAAAVSAAPPAASATASAAPVTVSAAASAAIARG